MSKPIDYGQQIKNENEKEKDMKEEPIKLEGWVKELDEYLQTYEGNKEDFCNGVRWLASRDDNPIVKRALEMMLIQEEQALKEI